MMAGMCGSGRGEDLRKEGEDKQSQQSRSSLQYGRTHTSCPDECSFFVVGRAEVGRSDLLVQIPYVAEA